ncbi:MAG: hypothetical protein ACPGJS_15040 [Flammeovirgaceae bacterium]
MKRIIYLATFIPIIFLCSGCFEIIEQINLEEKGNGRYQLIANFSQSKANINGLLENDSVMGKPIPSIAEITAEMEKAKAKLQYQSGISNVVLNKDFTNYVFNLSFDFSSIKALDNALVNTVNSYNKRGRTLTAGNYYVHSGNTFKRQISYDYTGETARNMNAQLESMMRKASFTAIYRFPQKIKRVSNPRARIAPNGTATMLKVNVLEIANSKSAIANTITLE